jgi:hypothetical protein
VTGLLETLCAPQVVMQGASSSKYPLQHAHDREQSFGNQPRSSELAKSVLIGDEFLKSVWVSLNSMGL